MTTIFWILLILCILMYLEGLVIAAFAGAMSQTSKIVWPLLLIFWPIALPILAYRTYAKYRPIIQQIQENPLIGSLLGLRPAQENPLQSLFATGDQDTTNPFMGLTNDVFTEVEPLAEQAEISAEETDDDKKGEQLP